MLQNCKKDEAPKLCTPEEILALSGYSTVDSIYRAKEIYDNTIESFRGEADRRWVFLTALANIYDAGRTQGIREERLKRKGSLLSSL